MKNRQKNAALLLCRVLCRALCITLPLSMLGGCGQKAEMEETAEDVAIVEASNPTVGDLKLSGEFIATINPDDSVYVIPKATAEVMQVLVKAGDVVEEGDVLAVLDDTMAQITMKSAQISLDNAQRAYNLSYGEGAATINGIQSDSSVSQVEDSVTQLQETLLDAMDMRERYQKDLKDAQAELADVKEEYDYRDDVDEIKDYAESLRDDGDLAGYTSAMARYQQAAALDAQWQKTIDGYKSAVDECESTIETVQGNIDSAYESYSQVVTTTNITNGELREEQKQVSKNSISAARLQVEQAQESMDTYTITAAISGVVEAVNIKEHDFAAASSPAFVISNKNTMTATYYVSEDVRNTFSTGQKISIEKDDKIYDGEVIEVGNALDTATGLFKVKAAIKGDSSGMLSGTKAKVTTDTYCAINALIIPYDAVYYDGTQAYVYTVADGKAAKTNITTGLYDVENIVITEGLSKDDIVITTWSAQLREGVAVSIRKNGNRENANNADGTTQE